VSALVADDNKENRDVLSKMLAAIGVAVITAENGQQAVEAVIAHQPDIVFMDIWMPVMDGIQALKEILLECGEARPILVAVSASKRKRSDLAAVPLTSFVGRICGVHLFYCLPLCRI